MWGPNEYVLLDEARLRNWDVRDKLSEIEIPTLVLTSTFDEISPGIATTIAELIPNAEPVEFEQSSHMPFWEEPEKHYQAVESFLHTP